MLAKLTSKNQVTLPKAIVDNIDVTDYFEVTIDRGRIVLTPVRVRNTNVVRDKLEALGVTEADVAEAVAWARR